MSSSDYVPSPQRVVIPNYSSLEASSPQTTLTQPRRMRPYTNLLIRLVFLGLIVYLVVSYVPTIPMMFETKLLISLLVVVTYSVFDLIGVTLSTFK